MTEIIPDDNKSELEIGQESREVLEKNSKSIGYGKRVTYVKVVDERHLYTIRIDKLFKQLYDVLFDYLRTKSGYEKYSKQKMTDEIISQLTDIRNKFAHVNCEYLIERYKIFRMEYEKAFHTDIIQPFELLKDKKETLWLGLTKNEIESIEGLRDKYFIEGTSSGVAFAILIVFFIYNNEHLKNLKDIVNTHYITIDNHINRLPIDICNVNKRILIDCCNNKFENAKIPILIDYMSDIEKYVDNNKLLEHCQYGSYYKEILTYIKKFVDLIDRGILFFQNVNDFNVLSFRNLQREVLKYEL